MKKLLCFWVLLSVACSDVKENRPPAVSYNPDSKDYIHQPQDLFDSIRIIPLLAANDIIVDPESDVIYCEKKIFLKDSRRKRVDVFADDGQYIGSVASPGRAANEYLGVDNVQIVDGLIAIYSYHNKAVYYYRPDGAFEKKEMLEYSPIHLLKDGDGFWGFSGYTQQMSERVVRMDDKGVITAKYLPSAPVIPMEERGAVFTLYKDGVLVRESLRNEIRYLDKTGRDEVFLNFDFGKYMIPDTYFDNSNPYEAAANLLKSDFAIIDRFFINDDCTAVSVNFQKSSDGTTFSSLGIEQKGTWKWLKAAKEGPLALFFSSARQLTSTSELVLIVDGERLKAFSAQYPNLIPAFDNTTDNPYIVLCRLK